MTAPVGQSFHNVTVCVYPWGKRGTKSVIFIETPCFISTFPPRMCKYRLIKLSRNFQYFIPSYPPICVIVEIPLSDYCACKTQTLAWSPTTNSWLVQFTTTVFGEEPTVKSMSEHTIQYIAVVFRSPSCLFVHVINLYYLSSIVNLSFVLFFVVVLFLQNIWAVMNPL